MLIFGKCNLELTIKHDIFQNVIIYLAKNEAKKKQYVKNEVLPYIGIKRVSNSQVVLLIKCSFLTDHQQM